ncbi:hypothetical protein BC351_04470 [Paenibacillus ferrarius]|uniref:Uncharacterized protein n=1 Tax=Paenibacillus ferrarius TaxID=1469647 RepID=A0A1V4HKV7_9BACL|nr:hypothetical protein BC351_04470 [Paenibacillus ferrarius]
MILCSLYQENHQVSPLLRKINNSFRQLRLIATVVGKSAKAEKWIKDYKTKAKALCVRELM